MANIILLFACLLAGVLLRATRRLPDDAHGTLNGFIINLALPALVLCQLHGVQVTRGLVWPVLMPWLVFLLSGTCFVGLARLLRLPPATTGALIMTAGLANTSFVGLPMIETFYGPRYVATGILIDQLGTYLVLSTAGITVACLFSTGRVDWVGVARRTATFPPLVALLLALALARSPYPPAVQTCLHRLGDTVAPLALVSVGSQLRLGDLAGQKLTLACGLTFKLVLAPLLIALLYLGALHRTGDTTRVTVFEAAMGPQVAGSIVAVQYGLNSPLATLMLGLGITLSLLTAPAWWWGLQLL